MRLSCGSRWRSTEGETLIRTDGADIAVTDSGRTFDAATRIGASLQGHTIKIFTVSNSARTLVSEANDVVAGDAFVVYGQSNAVSQQYDGSANGNQSPWVRTFGTVSVRPNEVETETKWFEADGDRFGPGFIGQWPLRLASQIVDKYKVPLAIINAGEGGKPISHFMKNTLDPEALQTPYGRLLYRARRAGLADGVRAFFWYQGESDGNTEEATPPQVYRVRFEILHSSVLEDFPSVEKVYVMQVRGRVW